MQFVSRRLSPSRVRRLALLSCLLSFGAASVGAQQQIVSGQSSHSAVNIPDNSDQVGVESPIYIDADLVVRQIRVTVDVEHPRIGDIRLLLFSPLGEEVELANNECWDGQNYAGTIFSNTGAAAIGDICPPGVGPYSPDESFDEFIEEPSAGVWALVVLDTEEGSTGRLSSWSMELEGEFTTGPTLSAAGVVSAASFLGGAVAPGEIVSLFGNAFGPTEGVGADFDEEGNLPTSLEGVEVTFNDIPAPLFYVSSRQINVQAPYELTGSETARIEIDAEQTGATSATVPVLESSPAIFTLRSSGRGHAVAINPNGSVNDRNNPAAPGDVVTIYASGLGPVQPEQATGAAAPADPPPRWSRKSPPLLAERLPPSISPDWPRDSLGFIS